MSGIIDNWPAVRALFAGLPRVLDLDRQGVRDRLGDELLDRASQGVFVQTVARQLDPDNAPLAPLAPSTLLKKRRAGYPDDILIETQEMTAPAQLDGVRTVTRDSATSRYGLNDRARGKAAQAHEGARNRPQRPFYAVNDLGAALMDAHVDLVAGLNLDLL